MNLRKLIFTKCDAYKEGRKIVPKGIMVHSTGANNPHLKRYVGPDDGLLGKNIYGNHWNRPNTSANVHAFIGKLKDGTVATYQVLPWDCRAGHCYYGKNGSGNNTHIGFEICEDNLKDADYFRKVYQEAVELCAYLCEVYKLDPLKDGVLIDHNEGYDRGIASNHADISHWWPKYGKSMDTFRADVAALVKKTEVSMPEKATTTTIKNTTEVCNVELNVLRKGNKGDQVKALQMLLIGNGFSCGSTGADGDFGSNTDTALRNYQKKNGLVVDGIAGQKTWGKLLGTK